MAHRPIVLDGVAIGAAFALCPLAAALAPADPAGPLARAEALVAFERDLGLLVEPAVHGWFAGHPALLAVVGFLYLWGHVPATVGALVWARLEHPRAFGLARDAFIATQALVVAGYLLAPTAPPRMLERFGADFSGTEGWTAVIQSPYAALPSGHVAFAVIVAGIVSALAAWRWVRWVAPLYPAVVTVVVIGTANHFWLDAAAGTIAAASGWGLAVMWRTRAAAFANRRAAEARTAGNVGPDSSAHRRRARATSNA